MSPDRPAARRTVNAAWPERNRRIPLGRALIALLIACWACERQEKGGAIRAMGTLEVLEVDVAPSVTGRVERVLVEEGAVVRAGDTLVVLTQPTSVADLAQREARIGAAAANLRELQESPRAAEIARAEADVRAAESEAKRAQEDLARIGPLAERSVVSQQQLNAAQAAARTTSDRLDAARAVLRLVQEGAHPERIAAARAEVASAEASRSAVRATISDLVLRAPVDGVVMTRSADRGEVLTPGRIAMTIGDLTRPWVRVYVGEKKLPGIRVGEEVTGRLDGVPDRTFRGRVVSINPKAEYTPRVALTEEERADLMFGVKVEFTDTSGMLKPGLPMTVTFGAPAAGR
jgi:HlyD family secretion protein